MGFVKTLSRHGNAGGGKGRFRAFAGFMVSKSQRQVSREHTGRGARQLSPSELSIAVRVASQGPRKNDLRMWREYAEATLFHVAALQPNHMAFIANGFARADVPDREVFDRMSDHALRQVPHFEPRDMALFLNAYARLQFRDLALFNSFSKSIRRASSVGYGEQQLSLLCNAYARLELADTELFKKLSRWTARRIVEFTPQGVATVANAYAKVLLCDETLLGALREGISRNGAEFKAQHVANLLNAFARLELKEERVALDKLATQIPNHSRDFQPLELSQALHALVKLNLAIDHRKSMICLAEAVQDKADEFHSRQLALTLHSFSLLNTSYGRMLQNMAPQVLSTLNMADHQSAAMVFCAYARAGQVHSEVLQALAEKLYLGVAEAGEQMQVQLFYACGRFGLYKEPLSIALAELLQQNVRTLSGQHLANCLLTLSRLSLCNEQFASLQAALQARLLRRDVHFEPQHLANSLHALAGIYGDGAPPQAALSSPLPGSVVPRLVDEVVQGSTWQQNPQLLASVAIASARLRQGSPELFSLVSQTVRRDVARGTPKLSKQNQSELLWSFAVSGFFDLQLFSWVMSQLDAGSLSSVPMDVLLSTLQCLDYVSFSGQLNEQETDTFTEPEHWQGAEGGTLHSLLFLQCPASFQLQALNFYQRVGLTLLLHSPKLPAKVLEIVAPAFARAGLLEAVPFDLLKPSTADFFGEAASAIPEPPFFAVLTTPEESKDGLDTGAASTSLMEFWLEELSCQEGGSSSSSRPCGSTRLAYLLARYAKLLPGTSSSLEELPSVPGVVLDPLLRKMGAVLRDSAQNLSFEELAETLATLADAGIRPTDVWEALTEAAEVDRFAKTAAVTEANLIRLERRLHGRAQKRIADDNQSVISGVSNYSGMTRSRSAASIAGREVVGSKFELPASYDWTRLDEYASYLHEQDALRQQLGVKALQRKMRMDLDQQVAEKSKRKTDAVEEDRRYFENSLMEMERWKEQEQLRQDEKQQRIVKEKLDRDAQLEYERKLKDEELQKKKDEEASLVEKIVNEMELEQRRYEKKKDQTKRAMRKVFEENMEDQRRRNIAKKEATEKEAETMKEYNRLLDEQEGQRAMELAARMERQSELMKKLQENVDSVKKGAGDNDAQRAALQAEEQDRHYFEAESVKQNRLQQMRFENQAYLLKQMEEKDSRKNEEKYLQQIQAAILERDAEEYNAVEKQKVIDRKLRNLEHRKDIERQMEYKSRQSVPEMSEAEIQLNRPLLELVERTLQTRDEYAKMAKEVQKPIAEEEEDV